MSITTQRYLPQAFSAPTGTFAWTSGQALVSGSLADWSTCIVASGVTSNAIILRDFSIAIPDGKGVVEIRVATTGTVNGGAGDYGQLFFQLYDGSAVIGTSLRDTLPGATFTTGVFNAAYARRTIGSESGVWGTNVTLTNTLLATTGFGVSLTTTYNNPPADAEFAAATGTFRLANLALEIDYDDIAKIRDKGQTLIRLGNTFIKQ